jgi:hypothetical protein
MKATIFTWTLLLTSVSIIPAAGMNQVLLRNLDLADGTPAIWLSTKRPYLRHSFDPPSHVRACGVMRDLNGSRLASLDIAQMQSARAAVTDAQNNLVIAGQDVTNQGIIRKLAPQLRATLFSHSLPGSIGAAAVDAAGTFTLPAQPPPLPSP